MEALRQAWATITKYLGQLAGRDRALIFSLVAVAIMALILVASWSGRATQVELLPGMGPEDQANAQSALQAADIPFTMSNGRIMVAPEKKIYAIGYLSQSGKMPTNSAVLFNQLIESQNWMLSKTQSDQQYNALLTKILGEVIATFKGVERATVMLDVPEPIGLGTAVRKPTGSVGVLMKSGKALDRELVEAISGLVAGSKAGLKVSDIKVIDLRNGRQFSSKDSSEFQASEYMELVAKIETRVQEKVREQLRFDPFAIVAVSAQVDNSSRKIRDETVKPDGKGSVSLTAKEVQDTTSEGSGPSAPGNEPGVQSNVAADINRGTTNQAPQNRSSKEKTDTEFVSKFGGRIEESINPGGAPTRINVMVSLSREYIVSLIRAKQPPATAPAGGAADATTASPEPTMAEIKAAFDEEKKRLETDLTPLVRTASSAAAVNDASLASIPHVVVSLIPVPQIGATFVGGVPGMQAAGLGGSTSGTGGAISGLAGQVLTGSFIRTALLGVLAVGALGMMMMLVKKSSKPQALPTAQEIVGLPPVMESTDEVVGEADESATALEGIELGESEIQAKKRLEAVQEMVSKSPQDAAGLMKRWLSNEK